MNWRVAKGKRYQAITEVRKRINDELTKDVAALEEAHPKLLEELWGNNL